MSSEQKRDLGFQESFDNKNMVREQPCVIKILTSVFMGLAFGVSLEKGRVFEPMIIREQMVFTNFTMLKMFLSAVSTGMLVFSVLTMIPATQAAMSVAYSDLRAGNSNRPLSTAVIGAAILGFGMTLAGACPGMVLAQVGVGVPNSGYTILGGMLGALLYGIIHPSLPSSIILKKPIQPKRLDEYLGTPYFILALPLAACIGTIIFALEEFFPWTTQVHQEGEGLFTTRAWPPFVSGALVGLAQIPAVLILHDTLGSSGFYVTTVAQLPLMPSYFKRYASGMVNWWQVIYCVSAMLGAHLSSRASWSESQPAVAGVDAVAAAVGGMCMVFGSRLAAGCTSGHGLSGFGLLSVHSILAVPAMFGAAAAAGFVAKYVLEIGY